METDPDIKILGDAWTIMSRHGLEIKVHYENSFEIATALLKQEKEIKQLTIERDDFEERVDENIKRAEKAEKELAQLKHKAQKAAIKYKIFPILGQETSIPWEMAEEIYKEYSTQNGDSQS